MHRRCVASKTRGVVWHGRRRKPQLSEGVKRDESERVRTMSDSGPLPHLRGSQPPTSKKQSAEKRPPFLYLR